MNEGMQKKINTEIKEDINTYYDIDMKMRAIDFVMNYHQDKADDLAKKLK